MSSPVISGGAAQRSRAWPLELELEVCAAKGHATDERLLSLAVLLNDADGVSLASAEAYQPANLVRLRLTVDARDLYDALDRVSGLVHDCVRRVGLRPAILAAARELAATPRTDRRMG